MDLTIGEKIKIIMKRKGITMTQLAELVGQSRQNLTNKISRDNFTEEDARKIGAALGYKFHAEFVAEDAAETDQH